MKNNVNHHCHSFAHTTTAVGQQEKRMVGTFFLTAAVMVVEAVAAWYSHSLALWADAGHMLTDLLALSVSLVALILSHRPADHRRTYGYRRLEVLAALANSLALLWVAKSIVQEAVSRLLHPTLIDISLMLSVALFGFAANLGGLALLGHHNNNINLRGAFLHIVGDTLSSLAVVAGGLVMRYTGLTVIDPILSIIISLVIVITSLNLLREVFEVLLEAAPQDLDTQAIRASIGDIDGVLDVHDLHVWSITSGVTALSAHIVVADTGNTSQAILKRIQVCLQQHYNVNHTTLQFEQPRSAIEAPCGCA